MAHQTRFELGPLPPECKAIAQLFMG